MATYVKKIVCLANSWKTGGRCIAGKIIANEKTSSWIRPVSTRPSGELNNSEHRYSNNNLVEVGHIFSMAFQSKSDHPYQIENHVVDPAYHCGFNGKADFNFIESCLDSASALPWPIGYSTRYGLNEQVPASMTHGLGESLRLIKVRDLNLIIAHEWPEYGHKRNIRGSFSWKTQRYTFKITDPKILSEFSTSPDGEYTIGPCILCISLSELHKGFAYKLIATVFRM